MDSLIVDINKLCVSPSNNALNNASNDVSNNASNDATESAVKLQKPFLKWVGGKTQLLTTIIPCIPQEINNYYEPFVGGGSVLLAVLSLQQMGKINIKGEVTCSDYNRQLINVYKCMQTNPQKLYDHFTRYLTQYHSCITNQEDSPNRNPKTKKEAMQSKESYYYWIRKQYNTLMKTKKDDLEMAGQLLFLNKTCFRGMYREGPNGFNVPYGHYKQTPQAMTINEFKHISSMLQNVQFKHCDFSATLDAAVHSNCKQDFIYMDPPYAPMNATSFVQYNKTGFNEKQHQMLFTYMNQLSSRATVLMSNSNTDVVRNAFESNKRLTIKYIDARRAINAKNPGDKVKEVLVENKQNL